MASIVDTRLYDILGVSPNASDSDLKKAFRRLAKECHPDKNPNATAAEKFKELNFAYEVLSNPEKRDIYNRLGEKGLREGGDSSSMDDIFSHIFGGSSLFGGFLGGGMHSRGGSNRRRRGEDMVHPLKVSLEDLYNGKVTKLQLSKNVICAGCKGIGGKAGSVQPCATCKGRGFRIVVQQLVPGMVQQMKSVCHICRGEGEIMNERDRCKQCEGKKVVKEVKILEVHVDKGMRQGQKITFRGEGDQAPDMEPGDIILVLQEKEHEMFRRNGNDLHMTKRVGLCEALCGVCFALNHLDGRQILVTSPAGKVIYPGCTQGVCGEGMPMYRNPFEKGDLYIKFDIEFPENNWIDAERLQELEQLLPARPDIQHPVSDYEDVDLHDLESTKGGGAGARREAYDDGSDDEGGYHHGQGVQCTHQ